MSHLRLVPPSDVTTYLRMFEVYVRKYREGGIEGATALNLLSLALALAAEHHSPERIALLVQERAGDLEQQRD